MPPERSTGFRTGLVTGLVTGFVQGGTRLSPGEFWCPDPRLRRTTGSVVIGVFPQGLLTALKVVWGIFAAGSLALRGSLLS
jgi:hypothetical protein